MKILYVYRDYKGRRKKYGKMMEQCGHKVKYLCILEKKIKNQVNKKDIARHKPDILWLYTPHYLAYRVISDEAIDYCKANNILVVIYSTVLPDSHWKDQLWFWKKFDYAFIHYKQLFKYLKKNGVNAFYSPLGFYPDQFNKIVSSKKYDVSFMGTAQTYLSMNQDKRVKYLKSLSKYKLAIHGEGFDIRMPNLAHGKFRGLDIQRKIYSKTKVNLDIPIVNWKHILYKDQYHFKNRFFEIPATGNFLLTVRCPEFLEIFPEDTVGYYDDDIESLKESVKKYLKDKKLRKQMAEKSYKLVHQKYTYLHRFKEMFKIINK
jgi:spore maturation protein CgeB